MTKKVICTLVLKINNVWVTKQRIKNEVFKVVK